MDFFTKVIKISLQSTQKQIYTTKKSKKGNDIETSELLWSSAFAMLKITRNKDRKNVLINRQILQPFFLKNTLYLLR
jgi:hypothetical protein